jgi:hypothetical protein
VGHFNNAFPYHTLFFRTIFIRVLGDIPNERKGSPTMLSKNQLITTNYTAKTKYGRFLKKLEVRVRIQVITNFAGIFSGNHFSGFFISIFRKERAISPPQICILNLL